MLRLYHEILLEIFGYAYDQAQEETRVSEFIALATVNRTFFHVLIPALWKELSSAEPLLHLIPDHALEKQFNRDHWSYTSCADLTQKDLTRLYLYAPYIREIRARRISLTHGAVHAFRDIARVHSCTTANPLLPRLNRLRLRARHDSLLEHMHILLHNGLTTIELPYYATGLESAMSALLASPPPLRTLVYVDLSKNMKRFEKSLHLLDSIQHLTVSLLGPTGMQAIASLPSLVSLTVVVDDSLSTLPYTITSVRPIASLEIILQTSLIFGGSHNNGLHSAICLLHALPIPCRQLTIVLPVHLGGVALTDFIASLAQDFNTSSHSKFSAMDLRRLSVHAGIHGTDNSSPLPLYFLQPLYDTPMTHIDLGCFSMCRLDDDALHALSFAFPSLESIFLGSHCYWSDPPRASLAGLSAVLRNCPRLNELGLVFSCSVGALDLSLLPVNTSITTLHVGVSPPYNPSIVSAFLARALPCLKKIRVETYYISPSTMRNHVASDRFHRESSWSVILSKVLQYKQHTVE